MCRMCSIFVMKEYFVCDRVARKIGLFAGHCGLRSHMVNMGKSDGPTCRLSLEEDEKHH